RRSSALRASARSWSALNSVRISIARLMASPRINLSVDHHESQPRPRRNPRVESYRERYQPCYSLLPTPYSLEGYKGPAMMVQQVKSELAPGGVLRAGLNLSNFLLVSGKTEAGEPTGVAPDMAAEIARRLGVPVRYVPYKTPGELADAAETGAW